jgi:Zn-finger nucleic acid-binding protein
MCEYCEKEKTMMQRDYVNLSMIHYTAGVFIDNRGYLRLVDLDDCSCLDHGEYIKINYCPMCGKKLK